jgi:hypothetical protein
MDFYLENICRLILKPWNQTFSPAVIWKSEPEFLNISWLFAWKDTFLTIPAFSGFLDTQDVFLKGWLALLHSIQ